MPIAFLCLALLLSAPQPRRARFGPAGEPLLARGFFWFPFPLPCCPQWDNASRARLAST